MHNLELVQWILIVRIDPSMWLGCLLFELLDLSSHSALIRPACECALMCFVLLLGGQRICVRVCVCMGSLIVWSIWHIATNWFYLTNHFYWQIQFDFRPHTIRIGYKKCSFFYVRGVYNKQIPKPIIELIDSECNEIKMVFIKIDKKLAVIIVGLATICGLVECIRVEVSSLFVSGLGRNCIADAVDFILFRLRYSCI